MACRGSCERKDSGGQYFCGDCSLAQAEAIEKLLKKGIDTSEVGIYPQKDLRRGIVIDRKSGKRLLTFPD